MPAPTRIIGRGRYGGSATTQHLGIFHPQALARMVANFLEFLKFHPTIMAIT
jgi:hypothetical protein